MLRVTFFVHVSPVFFHGEVVVIVQLESRIQHGVKESSKQKYYIYEGTLMKPSTFLPRASFSLPLRLLFKIFILFFIADNDGLENLINYIKQNSKLG